MAKVQKISASILLKILHMPEITSKDARIIFVRRYWYADSVAQIAKYYGMSESKVKSSLMRSRNKLQAFLEKEGITV